MYQEADCTRVRQQIRRRTYFLIACAVPLLAGAVLSFILRSQVLADLFSIALAVFLIAFYELGIRPLRRYLAHLEGCLHGRSHELVCTFLSIEPELSLIDGVRYHAMKVMEAEEERPSERLFYWDAALPFPGWQQGQLLRLVYHDRELVSA